MRKGRRLSGLPAAADTPAGWDQRRADLETRECKGDIASAGNILAAAFLATTRSNHHKLSAAGLIDGRRGVGSRRQDRLHNSAPVHLSNAQNL